MKNSTRAKRAKPSDRDELRPEYRFDYAKSRPNRFAKEMKSAIVVVLDPDVAKLFPDGRTVNEALRLFAGAQRASKHQLRKKSAA